MDEFGILTQSIGFKPQGKSAPMAESKRPTNTNATGTRNFGFVSGVDTTKSARNSNSVIGSFLGDPDKLFRSSDNQKTQNYGNLDGYSDIFGGPLKNSKQSDGSSFDYDSIFMNLNDSGTKTSSLPVHDKPVYDDIFGGVPGLKSSAPVEYDDVFVSFPSSSKQSAPFDDFLRNLGRMQPESKGSRTKGLGKVEKNAAGFDDLIPGFGGSRPLKNGVNLETIGPRQSTVHSAKSTSAISEDPFLVLESSSTPANTSSGLFSDPFEQFNQLNYSGSTKLDGSSNSGGVYDDMDPLDGLAKSTPMNGRTGSNTIATHTYAGRAEANKTFMKTSGNRSQTKVDTPSRFEENLETADDAWLNTSEIPLFTQPATASPPSRPPPPKRAQVSKADRVKSSGMSSIDELEDFAMGGVRKNADVRPDVRSCEEGVETLAAAVSAATFKESMDRAAAKFRHAREVRERQSAQAARKKEATDAARKNQQKSEDDLESFFSMGSRPSSAPRSRATTLDPVFDTQFHNVGGPGVARATSSRTSSSMKKAPSVTNIVDDLSSIFGDGVSSGEFLEVEGESEERRRARLGRHQRTQERVAKAVSDKNQRDLQTQQEQEERHRIAETLDGEIKRWAAGKEGNLRALLSSLHFVLGTECGWQPVSLTDMITSTSVKKVYRKATLCIHPDKLQQKGANLQQKYMAEKVFDVLKEAWNKFNSEELS